MWRWPWRSQCDVRTRQVVVGVLLLRRVADRMSPAIRKECGLEEEDEEEEEQEEEEEEEEEK